MISITKRTYSILKLFDDVSVIKNKCLFIDETRDQIFQVMEYCPFPSLRALVRENPLPYS
jgi:serine/threonine protein kinase